jgi:hypothetical protein
LRISCLGTCQAKIPIGLSGTRTFLELPKQPRLPSFLDGRHPLSLTEDGRLVGEVLDQATFIRMREELGARILTNARSKVAQALGFSGGGAAGIVRAVKVSHYPKAAATI